MRGAFNKDVLRSVTHSLGRFLAIAGIVALGTGFYAGLRMTAPDMKLAADQFYDGTNLMDIRVVSTLGLTDDDLAALRGVEGVAPVMGAYETDVMATVNDEQYATACTRCPPPRGKRHGDGVNAVAGRRRLPEPARPRGGRVAGARGRVRAVGRHGGGRAHEDRRHGAASRGSEASDDVLRHAQYRWWAT